MRKLLIHMTVLTLAGIAPAWAGNAPSDVLDPTAIFETEKPMLNEHIVVESNVVRLGDLFTNAGTRAEAAVAYSPAAGQRSVLDARWLYRVARAYKINWKPLGATTQVVVERDSISIPQDEIKTQILFSSLTKVFQKIWTLSSPPGFNRYSCLPGTILRSTLKTSIIKSGRVVSSRQ